MNLREWQIKGWEFFKQHPNCIFEVATGSGKTYMAIYIIRRMLEENPYLKILIVGPKNVILEHTWMDELYNHGFPINRVGLYNQSAKEFSQITLVSIQSLHNLIKSGMYDVFDMVIFDEVHNYGSETYIPKIKEPKKYKIGLTATLHREDGCHILLKQFFGYNVFTYNISEALRDNILNPFEFYHINLPMDEDTKEEYRDLSDRIKFLTSSLGVVDTSKLDKENKEHLLILQAMEDRTTLINNYALKKEVVKDIIKQNPSSKILIFNQYNLISRNLYWELQDDMVSCDIMNSEIPEHQKTKIFREFEQGKLQVLLATTMLDEGYNLPKIDIAILMAQNSTQKQFVQRMGRVLRKKDVNSKVYYITVEGTYEEDNFINKKEFIKSIALKYEEL